MILLEKIISVLGMAYSYSGIRKISVLDNFVCLGLSSMRAKQMAKIIQKFQEKHLKVLYRLLHHQNNIFPVAEL